MEIQMIHIHEAYKGQFFSDYSPSSKKAEQ